MLVRARIKKMVRLAGRALALVAMMASIVCAQCALSCSLSHSDDSCCPHEHTSRQVPCPHGIASDKSHAVLQALPATVSIVARQVSCTQPSQIDFHLPTTSSSPPSEYSPSILILRV